MSRHPRAGAPHGHLRPRRPPARSRRADAATLTGLYADDAVIEIVDTTSTPSSPRRLEGIDAIRAYYDDVCSRDMTHEVQGAFTDGDHLAFRVACRYASGERVLASETCEVEDGRIVRETLVQAWDG